MKSTPAMYLLGIGTGLIVAALVISVFNSTLPASMAQGSAQPPADTPSDHGATEVTAAGAGVQERGEPEAKGPGAKGPGATQSTETAADGPSSETSSSQSAQTPVANDRPGTDGPEASPGTGDESGRSEIEGILVSVPRGATATEIGKLLAEAGLMRDEQGFLELVHRRGAAGQLREGHYRFSLDEPLEEVLERLIKQRTELPLP